MRIELVKSGIRKLLTPIEAQDLFDETHVAIQNWDEQSKTIRRYFYELIRGDAFVELKKFDTEKELFQELCNLSTLHRSTLYDYKNAALIEVELCLEHGKISVNALLELKTNTTEDSRKEIWQIAENNCRFDEKNPIPTKPIIAQIKKRYQYINSPEGKADREALFNDQDDEIIYSCDEYDDNRQMTAEKALITIKNYSLKELESLSKCIFPTSKVENDVYQILRNMTDDELEKFKADLHALCNHWTYDLTDEQIAYFAAWYHEEGEPSNDGAREYTEEEIAYYAAEYQACEAGNNNGVHEKLLTNRRL